MWILRAVDPLRTPIVQRCSFLFKLQIFRFTGILTGNVSSKTLRQPISTRSAAFVQLAVLCPKSHTSQAIFLVLQPKKLTVTYDKDQLQARR